MNIYDFTVKTRKGQDVALSDFKGKVLLVVNTATGCGFTPQYKELQEIYDADHDKGLEILDFPCNQFGNQAPGDNAIPLYQYITANTKFGGFGISPMAAILSGVVKKMDKDYKNNGNIKWNFTKILVNRDGEIVARFEPTEDMKKVAAKVEEVL